LDCRLARLKAHFALPANAIKKAATENRKALANNTRAIVSPELITRVAGDAGTSIERTVAATESVASRVVTGRSMGGRCALTKRTSLLDVVCTIGSCTVLGDYGRSREEPLSERIDVLGDHLRIVVVFKWLEGSFLVGTAGRVFEGLPVSVFLTSVSI